MPSFNAPQSPSLRKTEAFGNRSIMRPKQRFSIGRIIGDPFALATISISILAWLIAFVSNIISDIDTNFPNFVWWAIVYFLCCIIGVIIAVGGDAAYTYHVAIVGFLSAGLVLTTSAVNSLVYSSHGAEEAAAAGFILLSMVAIVWIFYFGSQPSATPRVFIDSFALHKGERPSPRSSRQMSNHHYGHNTNSFAHPSNNTYANNHLNGFETTSPGPGLNGANGIDRASQPRFGTATQSDNRLTTVGGIGDAEAGADAVTEYPFKAKAIYPYEANPDDANEISFAKHEILEVSDVSGRWWQARKATGEVGIAPSNYLILL